MFGKKKQVEKVRYAVVGLGYFAQAAVLPAFANAKDKCELTALVSGEQDKLTHLGKKYGVENLYSYDQYDEMLASGLVDAVYIALPNSMHCEYAVRAAKAGVHVLCEKPLAVSEDECNQMIAACEENDVKLMTAYRLHFEEANMEVVELIASGKIGEPRFFTSSFSMQVREGDIRTQEELGGGVLFDLGVYCINASRYVFQAEPVRVTALISNPSDTRFSTVDGLTGALLDFGNGRLASFVTSFGASNVSCYEVVGTEGSIRMSPAFDYETELSYELTVGEKTDQETFSKRDQIGPELVRFAECILEDKEPEASGYEGLADVRIIEAIYRSAKEGKSIDLPPFTKRSRPNQSQEMKLSAIKQPKLFQAEQPSRK